MSKRRRVTGGETKQLRGAEDTQEGGDVDEPQQGWVCEQPILKPRCVHIGWPASSDEKRTVHRRRADCQRACPGLAPGAAGHVAGFLTPAEVKSVRELGRSAALVFEPAARQLQVERRHARDLKQALAQHRIDAAIAMVDKGQGWRAATAVIASLYALPVDDAVRVVDALERNPQFTQPWSNQTRMMYRNVVMNYFDRPDEKQKDLARAVLVKYRWSCRLRRDAGDWERQATGWVLRDVVNNHWFDIAEALARDRVGRCTEAEVNAFEQAIKRGDVEAVEQLVRLGYRPDYDVETPGTTWVMGRVSKIFDALFDFATTSGDETHTLQLIEPLLKVRAFPNYFETYDRGAVNGYGWDWSRLAERLQTYWEHEAPPAYQSPCQDPQQFWCSS